MGRDVNHMLMFSGTDYVDDDDNKSQNHHGHDDRRNDDRRSDRNNNNGHQNNRNDQNRNNNGNQNGQNNGGNNNQQWNNPVCKIFRNDKVYDRDDVLDLLVRKDGLIIMIKDLKSVRKNPDQAYKASYVQKLLADIVVASAIPDALTDIFGKKYDENDSFSRKELGYLMEEILIFLNSSYDKKLIQLYGSEAVESMRRSYTDILYKYNKKKVKKLTEEIKSMSKANAKRICIITAGGNPSSIYQLLKFIRKESDSEEFFSTSTKSLTKLFKICYGKDNMDKVIKNLMLEKVRTDVSYSEAEIDFNANIDILIREYLESLDKEDIQSVLKEYVNDRKRQEKNGPIARRFGGSGTVHPDDYPKLTKVLKDLEKKDFSIIQYLRK